MLFLQKMGVGKHAFVFKNYDCFGAYYSCLLAEHFDIILRKLIIVKFLRELFLNFIRSTFYRTQLP